MRPGPALRVAVAIVREQGCTEITVRRRWLDGKLVKAGPGQSQWRVENEPVSDRVRAIAAKDLDRRAMQKNLQVVRRAGGVHRQDIKAQRGIVGRRRAPYRYGLENRIPGLEY